MPRTTRFHALNRAAALAASVSMLVPGLAAPVMAQNADEILAACTAEFGSDAEALSNCVAERTPGAATEGLTGGLGAALSNANDAAAQAAAQAEAEAAAQAAEQAEADAAAQAAEQAEADAAAQAAAQAEAEAAAQAEAEAAAQAAEQAEADAAAQAAAQAEAEAAAQAAEQAEADAAEQARVEAEAAADAAAQAAAQAEAESATETDGGIQLGESPQSAEAGVVTPNETGVTTVGDPTNTDPTAIVTDAPADGQGQPIETQAADGSNGAEALQDSTESPVATVDAPIAETETQSEIAAEVAARPEPELTEEEQTAVTQTEAALGAILGGASDAAAAAAAPSDDPDDNAQVREEVVDAEDVRTSDQDFETRAVVTEQEDRFDRNDKILLGALGALAVGAVLVNQNNRSRVVSNSGDRVVVQGDDGSLRVLKDDDVLLRQAGSNVRTERFDDGSTRQTVLREDGSRVVTIRDASLRVLRRELITQEGERYLLIDDTAEVAPVDVSTLPQPVVSSRSTGTDDPLAAALRQQEQLDRRFSLAQVRNIAEVRALAPAFDVSTVTFASGSAAIAPEQAANLRGLANEVIESIRNNPREVFLVEGHTDAVGDAAYNLALSDRRAESLALALNEYFGVPVENMVVQGYGESFLKVPTQSDERANRRATVRQITGLLQTAAAN